MAHALSAPLPVFRSDSAALAASALAAVFWGTSFEATRIALVDFTPWTAAAVRFALAAVAILIWLQLSGRLSWPVLRRNALAFAALGVIGVAGFNGALFVGLKTSTPVTAALIMGTSPLTITLVEAVLERRMPRRIALTGMAISLVGVALTVGAFSGAHFASGDVLILLGSLSWALYSIGCRRWVRDASPLETSAWTMLAGAVTLIVLAVTLETPLNTLAQVGPAAWGAIAWMVLLGSVLAYIFWQVGLAVRGPAATSVLFNLVPVSALVVAALFGRIPDPSQILGVFVAIFGVMLASGRLPGPWLR